ncbi:hypothetical protein AAK938_04385 [Aerococcaceae bacterium 50-4]
MTPDEEPRLTRAQYRALKNKIDHADKTGSEVASDIQEHRRPSQSSQDLKNRNARHRKSPAFNRPATGERTQVFKREEDLDAPRKFSADMLNQALYENKDQRVQKKPSSKAAVNQSSAQSKAIEEANDWKTKDDHVVATAKSAAPVANTDQISEENTDKKKRRSFKERLFGPSNKEDVSSPTDETNEFDHQKKTGYVASTDVDLTQDQASVQRNGEETSVNKGKSFFGAAKIDRFLNIAIVLLTIGIIILTIIAFYV